VETCSAVFCFLVINLGIQHIFFSWLSALIMLPSLVLVAYGFVKAFPRYMKHRDGLDHLTPYVGLVPWPLGPGRVRSITLTVAFDDDGKPVQAFLENGKGDRRVVDLQSKDGDDA
jgi:hypothetical protein